MQIRPLRTKRTPKAEPSWSGADDRRFLISDLCSALEGYLDTKDVEDVYRAYLFGAEAHEGQTRRSGEPYIYHPIAVARILADMRLDGKSIIAALLHDVIEDTATAKDQIARGFGKDVANLVDGVSKIDQIEFESKEEQQAENFRKMLMAMARDIRVIIVKLADRLHNMRTLRHLPTAKRRAIARETLDIYAPIANRLGMHQWCRELEDLGFAYLYPNRYRALINARKQSQGNRKAILRKIQTAIEQQLAHVNVQAAVSGREKNIFGVYEKMRSKRVSFKEVYDVIGFRIIVNDVDTCYRTLGVLHNLYKPIPGRFKDYVAIPKANGYQSLHTVVFGPYGQAIEIQIRTEDMHRIADVGVAAHWLYKSGDANGGNGADGRAQQLAQQWLVDLLETQRQAGNAREFLENLKVDLFPDEVYVFTPEAEIKKLPRGATALDFAYSVHTDIGNHCAGTVINKQRVPLRTVLRNGDHVEIITATTALPTPAWLNYAMTGKARATIRNFLKNKKRKESVRLGRRLLNKSLKSLGVKKASKEQKSVLLETLRAESWDAVLADIGMGNRVAVVVARQLIGEPGGAIEAPGADESDKRPLSIRGTEGMMVTYARCCRPIPGDPILGFLTTGRGIVLHTEDCPNVSEYRKHPEKWVDVQWERGIKGIFPVTVRVVARNERGVLARLATTIAEAEANIDNVTFLDRDGMQTEIGITMDVRDRQHLATIMRDLRAMGSVMRITRAKG